jgi:hypothetical protein
MHINFSLKTEINRLFGICHTMLTMRPKAGEFKLGRGNGFLRAIKIRSTHAFGGKVNPEAS